MIPLDDDDLLTALREARPDGGGPPSADWPQAAAMLARILQAARDPASRPAPSPPPAGQRPVCTARTPERG